ncbi:MAG: hypothetical protein KKF78_11085, partial [Candidatus Omnitrophica bacterium]|nr:hypothetical protein [Candidatus Omnitrophota bacterium]
ANTKYTGLLITFTIFIFAITYRRDLFKNSKFNFSLALPFLLLIPWFYWNFAVYGVNSIVEHNDFAGLLIKLSKAGRFLIPVLVIVVSGYFLYLKLKCDLRGNNEEKVCKKTEEIDGKNKLKVASYFLTAGIFYILLKKYVLNSIDFGYIPFTTWQGGILAHEPTIFYVGRLIEYFLIYIFAFASLFIFQSEEKQNAAFIRITATLILLFFIMWGNFQSRYVLSCVAFLLLLAANLIFELFDNIFKIKYRFARNLLISMLVLFITYAVLKVTYLNIELSFTNDMCYY